MIRSEAIHGVAFGHLADGDARSNDEAREAMSVALGIPPSWATISQVHGNGVRAVSNAGPAGEGDGLITSIHGLPIAIATADCVPIAIAGSSTVAIVHAGWRGLANGVIGKALEAFSALGDEATTASIGPHIGSCCYEVGDEVVDAIGHAGTTTWGTRSVDLREAAHDQLVGLEVEDIVACTMDDTSFASYRRNGTSVRQVAVAWLS